MFILRKFIDAFSTDIKDVFNFIYSQLNYCYVYSRLIVFVLIISPIIRITQKLLSIIYNKNIKL